jgi:hypothetical protein
MYLQLGKIVDFVGVDMTFAGARYVLRHLLLAPAILVGAFTGLIALAHCTVALVRATDLMTALRAAGLTWLTLFGVVLLTVYPFLFYRMVKFNRRNSVSFDDLGRMSSSDLKAYHKRTND